MLPFIRRCRVGRNLSTAPYIARLGELLGNKSDNFFKAVTVLQQFSGDAQVEMLDAMKNVAFEKDKVTLAVVDAMKKVALEKDRVTLEKDKLTLEVVDAMKKVALEKDKVAELKITVLTTTRDLIDATTENLCLKGKLDVRGMIEEIERLISPGKSLNPDVSRSRLWKEALQKPENEALAASLAACFSTQGSGASAAAINTIKGVYKKSCGLIHSHIESNNVAITVRHRDFPGTDELCVIRTLAKEFKFKLVEEGGLANLEDE